MFLDLAYSSGNQAAYVAFNIEPREKVGANAPASSRGTRGFGIRGMRPPNRILAKTPSQPAVSGVIEATQPATERGFGAFWNKFRAPAPSVTVDPALMREHRQLSEGISGIGQAAAQNLSRELKEQLARPGVPKGPARLGLSMPPPLGTPEPPPIPQAQAARGAVRAPEQPLTGHVGIGDAQRQVADVAAGRVRPPAPPQAAKAPAQAPAAQAAQAPASAPGRRKLTPEEVAENLKEEQAQINILRSKSPSGLGQEAAQAAQAQPAGAQAAQQAEQGKSTGAQAAQAQAAGTQASKEKAKEEEKAKSEGGFGSGLKRALGWGAAGVGATMLYNLLKEREQERNNLVYSPMGQGGFY